MYFTRTTIPTRLTNRFAINEFGYKCREGEQEVFAPEANVLELDDRFLVEVALPGVVLDDVELRAEQNIISVRARRVPALFEEQALLHIEEMPYTWLVRHFEFDAPVINEQVEARMDRGILYISVPKLEIAHRIPVSAGTIEARMLSGLKTQVMSKAEAVRNVKEAQPIK